MPWLILITPLIACYFDIVRPHVLKVHLPAVHLSAPSIHYDRNFVYIPKKGIPFEKAISTEPASGILDIEIQTGTFGTPAK